MRQRMLIPTFAAALTLVVGACEDADDVAGVVEDVAIEPDDPAHHFDIQADTSRRVILAEIESPTGSVLQFLEVGMGDEAGVLVLEQGAEGTHVLSRLLDLAGEDADPAHLYAALLDPRKPDAAIPARLLDLGTPGASPPPMGWAFEGIQGPITTAAASTVACSNSSFTASTPGGFLPTVFQRLDTGPSFHPGLWVKYTYDLGIQRFRYIAQVFDKIAWRGKVCGEAGYHPNVCVPAGCFPDFPRVFYQYRTGGSFTTAGWAPVGNSDSVSAWFYNGGLGAIDWRIMIDQAYDFDEFDVLMTWL